MFNIETIGTTIFWAGLSFVAGSVPTGYLMGKYIKGIDIRQHGSGNPGAANVFRTVGKTAGIATLIIDALKGYLPVHFALKFLSNQPPELNGILSPLWFPTLLGLFAVAGHNWSIFLSFSGGKGVATSTGMFLALIPAPTVIAIIFFLITFGVTQYVSLGSLVGSASLIVSTWFLTASKFLTGLSALCALLIFYLHRKNIYRLVHHQEPKISFRRNENETSEPAADKNVTT